MVTVARRCRHLRSYKLVDACYAGVYRRTQKCRNGNREIIRYVRSRSVELCTRCRKAEQDLIFDFYSLLSERLEETARRENWPRHSLQRLLVNLEREELKETNFYREAADGSSVERIAESFGALARRLEQGGSGISETFAGTPSIEGYF